MAHRIIHSKLAIGAAPPVEVVDDLVLVSESYDEAGAPDGQLSLCAGEMCAAPGLHPYLEATASMLTLSEAGVSRTVLVPMPPPMRVFAKVYEADEWVTLVGVATVPLAQVVATIRSPTRVVWNSEQTQSPLGFF